MHIQESGEMYLETILILSKQKSAVRSIDISEHMGYSKPSVSRAVGLLKSGNYIIVEDDGHITLSPAGREIAEKIMARRQKLNDMGINYLLNVGPDGLGRIPSFSQEALLKASF